jgi:hypothetical protein
MAIQFNASGVGWKGVGELKAGAVPDPFAAYACCCASANSRWQTMSGRRQKWPNQASIFTDPVINNKVQSVCWLWLAVPGCSTIGAVGQ